MPTLILQSVALLVAVFAVSALIGWSLAGRKKVVRAVAPAVDWSVDTVVADAFKSQAKPQPQPVAYLDAAAEHFTNGLSVPTRPQPATPLYNLEPAPQVDVATAQVAVRRDDTGLERRISSLAAMTPESVEAAVQQAGSGLEPVRLSAPQGIIDDLTIISGIDYASQGDLNALGIYHFWQIAGWTPEHVAWVSNRVRLSKRIARENWMSQAAKLAKLS